MKMNFSQLPPALLVSLLTFGATILADAAPPEPTRQPLVRVVDLDPGESADVELADGSKATVKLIELKETRDPIRDAVRAARVTVEVNGETTTIDSGNYHLPVTVGGVQIDCSITKGYYSNSGGDSWGLEKTARLRLWPAGSPWIEPGTFVYPVRQRWFASGTQFANEPVYVDGGELPANKKIYYHNDLDFGGCEAIVDVVAAVDGIVVSASNEMLPGMIGTPAKPRYDVVYLLDDRGWYYRNSHLHSIDVKIGDRVKMGQKIGTLGKEGASGGWSHLHFGIVSRQPSGKWGTQEAYAFAWEAYLREQTPAVLAVARPHRLVYTGDTVTLDGSKSWAADGKALSYDWTFTDGETAKGATVQRSYATPGHYSEVLKVTDANGHIAYDFAVVQVINRAEPDAVPPSIQAAYAPSLGVKAGAPITFKVRTFRTTHGEERWDFGDGSEPVTVKSDGAVERLAKDGFAVTEHRFAQAGDYLVRVERSNERGEKAIAHLWVTVEP
ncbi:MAG: PKD domain-containing protein [Verrucomicrobiae bacterium]|nr:PKD domain-containing protein [Verrucomicrobiae bacterium]